MTLRSSSFPDVLDANVKLWFSTTYANYLNSYDMVSTLFNVVGDNGASMTASALSDMPYFQDLATTGEVQYANIEQLYDSTLTHKEWVNGIKIERKLVDDDKTGEMMRRAQGFAKSAYDTRQYHAESVFNHAFDTGSPWGGRSGGDGIALCGAHPYSPTNATTQDNSSAITLTYPNLVTAVTAMRGFKNSRGLPARINPDTLIVGYQQEQVAVELLNSIQRPDTANNNINYFGQKQWRLVVLSGLDSSTAWFMADYNAMKQNLLWVERTGLEIEESTDFDSYDRKWKGYQRYSFGPVDWRWIWGSTGA